MNILVRPALKVLLASPRGFCAGVERAIQIVERAIAKYGAPVYVRHEIVHNGHVVERLRRMGAVFIEQVEDCPSDRPLVFSAHGVPKSVPAETVREAISFKLPRVLAD
jgi:4-hydroxy-3-methylbut-2-enyl diphosphate reductase